MQARPLENRRESLPQQKLSKDRLRNKRPLGKGTVPFSRGESGDCPILFGSIFALGSGFAKQASRMNDGGAGGAARRSAIR